jgi:hypothetical protein
MVRLLIEDVTLTKEAVVKVQIRFKGGASRELKLSRPRNAWQRRQTDAEVIKQIDHLLDRHTDGETAEELNRRGYRSGEGLSFDGRVVAQLRRAYHLKSRYDRLHTAVLPDSAVARRPNTPALQIAANAPQSKMLSRSQLHLAIREAGTARMRVGLESPVCGTNDPDMIRATHG